MAYSNIETITENLLKKSAFFPDSHWENDIKDESTQKNVLFESPDIKFVLIRLFQSS